MEGKESLAVEKNQKYIKNLQMNLGKCEEKIRTLEA